MSVYELLDLATAIQSRIDVQLSLFVTIHLAMFGGIIYVDRPLMGTEKMAAIVIYCIFATLSYLMMQNQAQLTHALFSDIAELATEPCCSNITAVKMIANEIHGGRSAYTRYGIMALHIFFFIAVILAIVFDGARQKHVKEFIE